MIHDFHAAVQFGKAEPKRVGHPDESYLPEDITTTHAVKAGSQPSWMRNSPTKLDIDNTVKAVCGVIVRIQYPLRFKPAEEGACKKCAGRVRRARTERDKTRPPVRYTTETPETA